MASVTKLCSVNGCDRAHLARGLCNRHYKYLRRRGVLQSRVAKGQIICTFVGCDRGVFVHGLCSRHYDHKLQGRLGAVKERDTHRLGKLPEYKIWTSMKQRCLNIRDKHYKYYGGRGIMVCERWANSFRNFYEDMGPRPSADYSIERVNNNGNYEPSNCRWATRDEQNANRREKINIASSGYRNVYLKKSRKKKKWYVRLGKDKTIFYVGSFTTLEDAITARDNFLMQYNQEHGN